jgi:uncharacterized protein YbjT (DUF2867 family)
MAAGREKLEDLRRLQVQEYVDNLRKATFFRTGLKGRFRELLGEE